MPFNGLIGQLREVSRIGADELSLEWMILDFLSLNAGRNDWYRSPAFSFSSMGFCMCLCPNRTDAGQASRWLSLDLCKLYDRVSPPRAFHFSVGIRGSGGVEKRREGEKFSSKEHRYKWSDFCSQSELVENKSRLMPDGALTVTCVLKRPGAPAGCEKVLKDIAKLLASGENSDVTVQVRDCEFQVHSFILFARSPALSASLRHETIESTSKRIIIEECEPDIFLDFLHHLYTGSVRTLTEQNVFGLYTIADRYLEDDLKQQCRQFMWIIVNEETFCATVKLALTYEESALYDRAIGYATTHFRSIICSSQWQNFNCQYPTEANQVLIKSLGPCKCQKTN